MNFSHDTLIIGAGLTGLLLTHRLHRSGRRVALIEARETLGGSARRRNSVEFFPATRENIELLEWTRSVSPIPLNFEVRDHRPQVFDEGKWRNFSGWGESPFASVEVLSHFSHTQEIVIEPPLDQVVRALTEQLPIAASTVNEITEIKLSDNRVSEVIFNGDKSMSAAQIVFTPAPALLNGLILGDALPGKHRTRLAKTTGWTSVTLELTGPAPLAAGDEMRVFLHNAKEFEPVAGRCFGERSLWMTLVPDFRGDEHEFIGQCIRHIKRQLKRAWPEALDQPQEERIYVQSNAFGQHTLKTKDPLRLPEIENLYFGNHALATHPGALGSLEMARQLESLLASARPAPLGNETVDNF